MTGYDYGNARLRVRASAWLSSFDYRNLLAATGLDAVLGSLAQGPYAEDVATAMGRYRGIRRLDEAVRLHLSRELSEVRSFYEERISGRLGGYLARWDIRNVRSILRDIHRRHQQPPSVSLLVSAGALDAESLTEIAAQRDVRSAVDLLSVWRLPSSDVVRQLRNAIPHFAETGDILVLERALDVAFGVHVMSVRADGDDRVAETLAREIDRINLVSMARVLDVARATGAVPAFAPIDGGIIPADTWVHLVGIERDTAASSIVSRLPTAWAPVVADWVENGGAARLDDGVEDALARAAVQMFRTGDALGIDVPLGYMGQQEAEARNLRLVGRAVADDLPREEAYDRLLGIA